MDELDEQVELLENVALCPGCGNEEGHEILRSNNRGEGEDVLVRCEGCSKVHTVIIRPPKGCTVLFTLSEGPESRRAEMQIDADERFTVGDEFEHEHAMWEITRLEMPDASSTKVASAEEVNVVWAVRKDRVQVKMTFTDGEHSFSDSIICEPDREFHCGNKFVHKGKEWRIRALHTGRGRRLTGKLVASRIRRVFLHKPQSEWEILERERKVRGRWRGQEFPGREEHLDRVRDSNFGRHRD